ncbi:MAG: lipopolysaccharide heptosyltransferase I [Parachlamydiaceae bacterium]
MDKILIVKTSALGDVVHTYPVISYLKRKFPHAQIDWVVESQSLSLVQSHPDITKAIPIATKTWRQSLFNKKTFRAVQSFIRELRSTEYDVVFDLQGNVKSGLITAIAKSKTKVGFGFHSAPETPNILFTNRKFDPQPNRGIREDYLSIVSAFFGEDADILDHSSVQLNISKEENLHLQNIMARDGQVVLVCPGSAWPNKQVTTESLQEFLFLVNQQMRCQFLFAWGSPEEKQIALTLQQKFTGSKVIDKLNLASLQNLMGMCDLVIAMDSLPLHLAATTKTKTFSIFGASSAKKYKPPGADHSAFQGACPYGRLFEKRCPVLRKCPTGACIRNLSGTAIFESFSKNRSASETGLNRT